MHHSIIFPDNTNLSVETKSPVSKGDFMSFENFGIEHLLQATFQVVSIGHGAVPVIYLEENNITPNKPFVKCLPWAQYGKEEQQLLDAWMKKHAKLVRS